MKNKFLAWYTHHHMSFFNLWLCPQKIPKGRKSRPIQHMDFHFITKIKYSIFLLAINQSKVKKTSHLTTLIDKCWYVVRCVHKKKEIISFFLLCPRNTIPFFVPFPLHIYVLSFCNFCEWSGGPHLKIYFFKGHTQLMACPFEQKYYGIDL